VEMKYLALFSARYDRMTPATAWVRRVVSTVVIALMAINLVGGAFSGYVHAHEPTYNSDHHHHGDDDHHDHGTGSDLETIGLTDEENSSSEDGAVAQLHEHGASVVLAEVKATHWTGASLQHVWNQPEPARRISDRRDTSERPPRVA
jgi:ABC-type nickel/cobalt efflux system permease component RcnA